MASFAQFPKIPRFFTDVTITEKIDGTNAQILIEPDGEGETGWCVRAGGRWITPESNNFGFAGGDANKGA